MSSKISVVIPTYNRNEQLSDVLDHILASDVDAFAEVEVIVVDDGSPKSAKDVVASKNAELPFKLRYLRQDNSGPAEARNYGFREASNEIVLFIDDDILVFPDLIARHYRAHLLHPGSVIFGKSPFVEPTERLFSYEFLQSLSANGDVEDEFKRTNVVASGNLSVGKSVFPDGLYKHDLRTPAAEEFELEHRLNRDGVPIFICNGAKGWHLQPPTIEDKSKQEFKYGVGAAEVWVKVPSVVSNEHIRGIVTANGPVNFGTDGVGRIIVKGIKSFLAQRLLRIASLKAVKAVERVVPSRAILFPAYRFLCGISLFAGVRQGLKDFGGRSADG